MKNTEQLLLAYAKENMLVLVLAVGTLVPVMFKLVDYVFARDLYFTFYLKGSLAATLVTLMLTVLKQRVKVMLGKITILATFLLQLVLIVMSIVNFRVLSIALAVPLVLNIAVMLLHKTADIDLVACFKLEKYKLPLSRFVIFYIAVITAFIASGKLVQDKIAILAVDGLISTADYEVLFTYKRNLGITVGTVLVSALILFALYAQKAPSWRRRSK